MGAPSVSLSGVTRVSNANTVTDGGNWDKWDASQNPAVEPDIVYEGANSLSNKVGTSQGGVELANSTGTHDFTGGGAGGEDRLWLVKAVCTNNAALNAQGSTGMIAYIGSGTTSDRYLHYWHGNDTYPLQGGWVFLLWDPNISDSAYRSATEGSPNLNAVDYFAVSANFSATSKSENVAIDAIDYIDKGGGLLVVGGDGASADATFEDFRVFDEDTSTNRYGVVRSIDGILYVLGCLIIGSATETDFTDATGGTMVFPDGAFGPGASGITVDLANASSVVDIEGWNFVGRGNLTGDDSRPGVVVSGTSGAATFTDCVFRNFGDFTLTSAATFVNCKFVDCNQIIANGATLTDCSFSGGTHGDGQAYVVTDDLDVITGCDFTFSDGHAIEWDGSNIASEALDGCTFTGYGASDTNDAAFWNSNTTGTLAVAVTNGSIPTDRNTPSSVTNFTASVAVTFTGMKDNTEVRVYAAGTGTELAGIENATAGSPDDRSFVASVSPATSVDYTFINETYENIRSEGFTWPATPQSIPVQQRFDRNFNNP